MIECEAAKRMNRLRWLWERMKFYRERSRTFARLRRCAAMDMEIDYRYLSKMGEADKVAPTGYILR